MTPAVLLMFLSMAAGVFVPGWMQKATNQSTGLDTPSSRPAPEVGLTGCLAEGAAPGTFILRGARLKSDDQLEKSSDYLVTPVEPIELQLDAHVNHSVRLFGVISESAPVSSSASTATEPGLPSLNAKELRMASETCAVDADDESEFEEGDASSNSGGRIRFADLGSAGMNGVAWPGMPGGFGGKSSLKSDFVPDLFAGIAGGYRIGMVTGGVSSSQKVNAADAGSELVSDSSDPTQTSGWVGSFSAPANLLASYNVDPATSPTNLLAYNIDPATSPANPLVSYSTVPAASAGPSIAVNAAALDLGVDLSGHDPFAVKNGPAPIPNPEPASLILLGTGLLGVAAAARRQRARRSTKAF